MSKHVQPKYITAKYYVIMSGRVSFKMPFEELRGKLATKQNGILYEGQEQGQNLATLNGKRVATNFDKYIVAYKRKGVPRFFIKSNTAVNQTSLMRRQKGAFAAAQYLWDLFSKAAPAGGAFHNSMRVWAENYAAAMGKAYTAREYFVAIVTAAITAHQQEIQFPNYRTEEPFMERGIGNPFYSTTIYNEAWAEEVSEIEYSNYILSSALKTKGLAQVIRDYADAFFGVMLFNISLNIEGVERLIKINARIGATFATFNATPYAKALRLDLTQTVPTILAFDAKTGKIISGSPFKVYTNADKTQAVTSETNINADLVLYA